MNIVYKQKAGSCDRNEMSSLTFRAIGFRCHVIRDVRIPAFTQQLEGV
jgi:hypothetical protein